MRVLTHTQITRLQVVFWVLAVVSAVSPIVAIRAEYRVRALEARQPVVCTATIVVRRPEDVRIVREALLPALKGMGVVR